MATIGAGVSLRAIYDEDSQFPFLLAAGITSADVGKAVALDTSAANQVKLAGDGDTIIGQLLVVENRVVEGVLVGTIAMEGGIAFDVAVGQTVHLGDTIVGAGGGLVKSAATPNMALNYVVEVDAASVVVILK